MEKTFEELIKDAKDKYVQEHFTEHEDWKTFQHYFASRHPEWFEQIFNIIMEEFGKQVREATKSEIENKANEYGEYGTADYAHELPTDRIKLTENK